MDLRCFIALDLPESLKEGIGRITGPLRAAGTSVKWVPVSNLHLTLKFLGNVPEDMVASMRAPLLAAVASHGRFRRALKGAGSFPGGRRPRVLWLGVVDDGPPDAPSALAAIAADIEAALAAALVEFGFEAETRPFKAHLTIGRVRSQRGALRLAEELKALEGVDFGNFEVREVSMMKSDLLPGGAVHTKLYGLPLGA